MANSHRWFIVSGGVLSTIIVWAIAGGWAAEPFTITDPRFIDRSYSDTESMYFRANVELREEDGKLKVKGHVADIGRGPTIWIPGSLHTWIGKATIHGYTIESSKDDPLIFWINKERGYVHSSGKGSVTMPDGSVVRLPRE